MRNFKNRTIWTGDNLPIMRGLNSESVDLIYLDPPFNSNKEYAAPIGSEAAGAAFKDTWTLDDVDRLWLLLLRDKDPTLFHVIEAARLVHGNGMASYLSMMAQRLREMHRILKPTGSIYLHCDPTASHYLKLLLDCVFGRENFRNEIVRQRTSSHSDSRRWAHIHDTLLFYAGPKFTWNPVHTPHDPTYVSKFYRFKDKQGVYRLHEVIRTASMGPRPNLSYEYKGYTPEWGWRQIRPKIEALDKDGRLTWSKSGRPYLKRYLHEQKGTSISSMVIDLPPISGQSSERVGYPTQKPLALLDRIIKASSNESDVILDPFAGCATACVAAERLGREWIGIDLSTKAFELVQSRLQDAIDELDLYHKGDVIHRTDQPQRTDLGKLPAPSVHKDLLFGKQSGQCGGGMVMFHKRNLTIDHIVPTHDGGTDHVENLWLLCQACNSSKGTKSQAEFLKERVKRGESIAWLQ